MDGGGGVLFHLKCFVWSQTYASTMVLFWLCPFV